VLIVFEMKSLQMSKAIKYISFGWGAFIAENLILSEYRTDIINRFDASTYHSIYNSCSLLACSSILYGFVRYGYRRGPLVRSMDLFANTTTGKAVKFGLRMGGLGLLSQTLPPLQIPVLYTTENIGDDKNESPAYVWKAQCPIDFKSTSTHSITRYPSLWALGLTSLSFAISPLKTHIFFFGFPMLFTLIGTAHIDSRLQRGIGGTWTNEMEKQSYFPLVRYITGELPWSHLKENLRSVNLFLAVVVSCLLP
jgi:uncharacterized membrane protein